MSDFVFSHTSVEAVRGLLMSCSVELGHVQQWGNT